MKQRAGAILVVGSANLDFVVRASHVPAPGETVLGRELTIVPGGKGANQAVACARAGGAQTRMLVALGQDSFAPLLEDSLRQANVQLHVVRVAKEATGVALICLADDAENAITVAPGANSMLRASDMPDLDGVTHLLLQLETPLETVLDVARRARAAGIKVVLNAAPARTLPAELLDLVDVLIVNQDELTKVARDQGSVAETLSSVNVPCAIVTLGSRGCCARERGEFVLQPSFKVTSVDTTAAGDTFCGVLVAALCAQVSLPEALRRASAAAALATTRIGAQASIPTYDEVEALLRTEAGPGRDAADALAAYCDLATFCGLRPSPVMSSNQAPAS
jgi:ribokinase